MFVAITSNLGVFARHGTNLSTELERGLPSRSHTSMEGITVSLDSVNLECVDELRDERETNRMQQTARSVSWCEYGQKCGWAAKTWIHSVFSAFVQKIDEGEISYQTAGI